MLDFFFTKFKLSHGFRAKKGQILGHFWSYIINFYFLWPYVVKCITMGYYFHVWGGVSVGLFIFIFFVISICTELFCFGRGM